MLKQEQLWNKSSWGVIQSSCHQKLSMLVGKWEDLALKKVRRTGLLKVGRKKCINRLVALFKSKVLLGKAMTFAEVLQAED